METIALSQRLHGFCLPGRGWATRHHVSRQRFKKMSFSWSPPSDHEYVIPDEKETSTTVENTNTASEGTPKVAGANEEGLSTVKKRERNPSKCAQRVSEKKQRMSIALPNDEIARDFLAITGKKLPRKPTKRSKIVQEEMDGLFPGSGLGPIILGLCKDRRTPAAATV